MRAASVVLALVLASTQVIAQERPRISREVGRASTVQEQSPAPHRGGMFWSGLALGIAGAYTGFLSNDARSSNFRLPTNYVPARVGQLGVRLTF